MCPFKNFETKKKARRNCKHRGNTTPERKDGRIVLRTCSRGMSVDFSKKSMSREVTMPTSLPPIFPFSVIGMPQNPFFLLISNTSPTCWGVTTFNYGRSHFEDVAESITVCWVVRTTGSLMKPCLYFLTFETSVAWYSGLQLWWIIPMPPQSWTRPKNQAMVLGVY